MFKKQGTSLLLSSSDNIDGTQTLLTQLSAVKQTSSEKRGKIQTTKMNKFEHLVNKKGTQSTMTSNSLLQQQFLLMTRFIYPNDLPMTKKKASFWMFLICSLLLDLSSKYQVYANQLD